MLLYRDCYLLKHRFVQKIESKVGLKLINSTK